MKLLLVTPEFPPDFGGGISVYCGDIARELRALGCSVHVLRGSAFVHGTDSYELEGVEVSTLETKRCESWLERFGHFGMFPELRRHLAAAFAMHEQANEGRQFDVVEVTDWGYLYLPWVMRSKARVLVQLHGSNGQIGYHDPLRGREGECALQFFLDKIGLEAAPTLSAQSQANVRWWEAILGRTVEYHSPPISPLTGMSETIGPGNKWLSVGRIQKWKGPHVACAAWKQLGCSAPVLEWIGRDLPHGESGQSMSVWLSRQFPEVWKTKIHPLGSISPSQLLERMSLARAILVPSLWDVLNRVALEGMALGKVVVISDGAGASDLIEHGVNGFVFAKGDATALAELVRQVDSLDVEELRKIGQCAALTILEKLNPARIAAERLKLFQGLPKPEIDRVPWLGEMLLPRKPINSLAFLDALPLRKITAYVAQRGARKFIRRRS